jgi:hypothetical protein
MNFNKIDLTPIVVLILIILVVFCLFGAVIANRDLFNMNTSSDQAEALTATQDVNALLQAKQQATLTAMQIAAVEAQSTLEVREMAKTQTAYNHLAYIEEQEAKTAQAAADRKRTEMKNNAKAFAETTLYYLMPFTLVAATIAVIFILNAAVTIKKKQAEAHRINAHRKLRAFRDNQKVLAATAETGMVVSQTNQIEVPVNDQNTYLWPTKAEIITKK